MAFRPDIYEAMKNKELPILLKVSPISKEANYDVIVYTYEKQFTAKQKREMRNRGDYSYIKRGLFKKVGLVDNGTGVMTFIYKAINAWGDGIYAKEFYDTARKSQIDNGFIESDESITDETILSYFKPASLIAEKQAEEVKAPVSPVAPTAVTDEDLNEFITSDLGETNDVIDFAVNEGFIENEDDVRNLLQEFKSYEDSIKRADQFIKEGKNDEALAELEQLPTPADIDEEENVIDNDNTIEELILGEFVNRDVMERSNAKAVRQAISNIISELESAVETIDEYKKEKTPAIQREHTPETITSLKPNEVFVFGSNTEGRHGLGAALTAKEKFGAKQGQAEGLQGQSYAIVTKDLAKGKRSIPLYGMDGNSIAEKVRDFVEFANSHPELKFYVTKLGSKLAGYSIEEIKNVFDSVNKLYITQDIKDYIPNNVILPIEYEVRTAQTKEAKQDNLSKAFSDERKQEIITNFAKKHNLTEDQAKKYINEALRKDAEKVIKKLNECY